MKSGVSFTGDPCTGLAILQFQSFSLQVPDNLLRTRTSVQLPKVLQKVCLTSRHHFSRQILIEALVSERPACSNAANTGCPSFVQRQVMEAAAGRMAVPLAENMADIGEGWLDYDFLAIICHPPKPYCFLASSSRTSRIDLGNHWSISFTGPY
jgi:hypothetical protein